jgi:hypothetical protein
MSDPQVIKEQTRSEIQYRIVCSRCEAFAHWSAIEVELEAYCDLCIAKTDSAAKRLRTISNKKAQVKFAFMERKRK